MKHIVLSLFITLFFSELSFSQINANINTVQEEVSKFSNSTYKLYRASNDSREWIYLKLNTSNGIITQVVIDEKNELNYETPINTLPLVESTGVVNDRFILKKTPNIYTYILLDQIDGRMWKAIWSLESGAREITPIQKESDSK